MAINKNHEFEELDGVKCGIVEKNVTVHRAEFLKKLLEYNRYRVVVVPTPAPKVAATPPPKPAFPEDPQLNEAAGQTIVQPEPPAPLPPAPPETFTIGVTDYTFNPINAIFGRLLKTPDGHIVTLAYWQQKENTSNDEIPYYESK